MPARLGKPPKHEMPAPARLGNSRHGFRRAAVEAPRTIGTYLAQYHAKRGVGRGHVQDLVEAIGPRTLYVQAYRAGAGAIRPC